MKVTLKDATKKFGKIIAVDDVSLSIEDKEFMVLLGPSGCGKTTTLRMIAGLETPDSGDIYIGDKLVNDLPPKDRNVAMVFQSYALYPYMSVFDNIGFPLRIRKIPKKEIEERVHNAAKLLEIEELLNRKPKELSGGQRQRVALGRAIIREPDIFLMDEPLSNLDAKLRVYMRAELKKLHEKVGATTIYVTHDQSEAMSMGDRIAILDRGVLRQVAPPSEIYDNPNDVFVGGFIGSPSMNMLKGTLVEKNGKFFVDAGVFQYPVSPEIAKESSGTEVIFGVRPEDFIILSKKAPHSIKAKIEVIEPLGRESILSLDVGGVPLTLIAKSTVGLSTGDDIWITIDENKLHIFDEKTKKRLGLPKRINVAN